MSCEKLAISFALSSLYVNTHILSAKEWFSFLCLEEGKS